MFENIPSALAIFLLFVVISLLIDRSLKKLGSHYDTSSSEVFNLLANSQRAILLFIAVVLALSELDFDVTALIAGLGLSGFALGFALKDAISNLVAGIMIVLYRPFELGDSIEIADSRGEVVAINLRHITIKSEAKINLVPNALFLSKKLTIFDCSVDQ